MKKLFCLIKHFTSFHEICPKQSPNGLFVSLFDQIGNPVLPFLIEKIGNPVRRWLEWKSFFYQTVYFVTQK
jgi:hypothetical protein